MEVRFSGKGTALIFSFCFIILGIFGNQKAEATTSIFQPKSELFESENDFNDFGLIQRQIEFGESCDEDKKPINDFSGDLSTCFSSQSNYSAKFTLFFSGKLLFKDLTILYHNLRI